MTREKREEALKILKYNSNVIHQTIDGRTDPKEVKALDMAIKALEQELCDDAISRQALKDLGAECIAKRDENGNLIPLGSIDSLPPVTTGKAGHWTRWIPVSERLPENGTYLVTVERIVGVPRIDMKSFAKDLNKVDDFDFPNHKCGWYDYDSEYGYWEDTKVTAWRPLPQPHKTESEG